MILTGPPGLIRVCPGRSNYSMKRYLKTFVSLVLVFAILSSATGVSASAAIADSAQYIEYLNPDSYTWFTWFILTNSPVSSKLVYSAGNHYYDANLNEEFANIYNGIRPVLRVSPDMISGNTLTFGSYPQTLEEDDSTRIALCKPDYEWHAVYPAETLAEGDEAGILDMHLYYTDTVYNGVKYRGVTNIIECTYGKDHPEYSDSYRNQCNYRWYIYEPIKWKVLSREDCTLISARVIDGRKFSNMCIKDEVSGEYYGDPSKTYYASDYSNSSVRAFLNGDFIDTAFSESEKQLIQNMTFETAVSGPDGGTVRLTDKVSIPYSDLTRETSYNTHDMAKGTDYARTMYAPFSKNIYLTLEDYNRIVDANRGQLASNTATKFFNFVRNVVYMPLIILLMFVPVFNLFGATALTGPFIRLAETGKAAFRMIKYANKYPMWLYYNIINCEFINVYDEIQLNELMKTNVYLVQCYGVDEIPDC